SDTPTRSWEGPGEQPGQDRPPAAGFRGLVRPVPKSRLCRRSSDKAGRSSGRTRTTAAAPLPSPRLRSRASLAPGSPDTHLAALSRVSSLKALAPLLERGDALEV